MYVRINLVPNRRDEEIVKKSNMDTEEKLCGIIMPISSIDDCSESHWSEVFDILIESLATVGFKGRVVSDADDSGLIHKRIIENLYKDAVVICDVSCKNPNVMFELGMRLAFDKPTIIIKDDNTSYSFDTSSIEHLEYPRDLRFSKIVEFKERLARKVDSTYKKSLDDVNYTTFLKHFGDFKVAKIDTQEVSGQEYILDELKGIKRWIARSEGRNISNKIKNFKQEFDICMLPYPNMSPNDALNIAQEIDGLLDVRADFSDETHYHLIGRTSLGYDSKHIEEQLRRKISRVITHKDN